MKKRFALCVVSAALVGYVIGRTTGSTAAPVVGGHSSDLSFIEQAFAQDNKPELMPFRFNSPNLPAQAPDAPPITHWSIDDIQKAHADMADKAAKLISQPGSGGSQAFFGGQQYAKREMHLHVFFVLPREFLRRLQPLRRPASFKIGPRQSDARSNCLRVDSLQEGKRVCRALLR